MRSSKSRSRSKQNRPRSLGNIINRVFDSSGPEGKVRGTPQQIIEKYQVLARDAQLSNDRVAAENFLQHAEHYTRMLAEAQREMAAEQEARQQQYQQNGNGNSGGNQGGTSAGNQGGNRDRDGRDFRDNREGRDRGSWRDDRGQDPGAGDQPEVPAVIDLSEDSGSTLVETPEARDIDAQAEGGRREDRSRREDRGRRDRRERGPRLERDAAPADAAPPSAPVAAAPAAPEASPEQSAARPAETSAEAAEAKPRRPRAPKKPKAEGTEPEGKAGPREAAE
jgi:hypothetical protein